MKISSFLLKKIKSSSFIGFVFALGCYSTVGIAVCWLPKEEILNLRQEGKYQLSFKVIDANATNKKADTNKTIKSVEKSPKKDPNTQSKTKKLSKPTKQDVQKSQNTQELQDSGEKISDTKEKESSQEMFYKEGVSDEFLSKIRLAISSHNAYPRTARMRKMEGEIVLEFVLNTNGELEELKILSSNASDLLNKSAIEAVYRASKDFPLPIVRVKIKVPIVYSLRA